MADAIRAAEAENAMVKLRKEIPPIIDEDGDISKTIGSPEELAEREALLKESQGKPELVEQYFKDHLEKKARCGSLIHSFILEGGRGKAEERRESSFSWRGRRRAVS